ncbi:MAG: hypothetical protein MUE97_05850 [Phycisphaerales bacterium]|jgi:hypothetical protein|nr:hypothetical protein [Phycisphaerales bacterium]
MGKIPSIPQVVETGRSYLGKLRLRALGWAVGIGLAAAAVISLSRVATNLDKPTCYACGTDLSGTPDGPQGIACPTCGSLHQGRRRLASDQFDERAIAQAQADDAEAEATSNETGEPPKSA